MGKRQEMKNEKYEEYFRKYSNLIIKIVIDKTGDREEALDICQQVFVSFYLNMDSISEDLVKAWLVRCTKNAIIDHYRKMSREKEIITDVSDAEIGNIAVDGGIAPAEERLDDLDLIGKVLRTVKAVNQQWFEVLYMNCVEGLSYAEMAHRLEVSETVLRARLYRARLFIKKKFGEDYQKR